MDLSLKIDLTKVPGAVRHTNQKTGAKMLIIPLDGKWIFDGEKGCYLNAVARERREPSFGNTHSVKISVDRKVFDAMSEEEKKSIPYIGDARELASQQQAPAQPTMQQAQGAMQSAGFIPVNDEDDLPF